MATVPLLHTVSDWYCPNCKLVDQAVDVAVAPGEYAARMHTCPRLHMLTAPLIPAGVACKVEAVERADYVGRDDVQYGDDGRVYMAVQTTRDTGSDVAVLAPTASAASGV